MKFGFTLITLIALTIVSSSGCNILRRGCHGCGPCNGPIGCRPCSVGWQRGGTDYGHHLGSKSYLQTGCGPIRSGLGALACHGDGYGDAGQASGVQAPATGYPYYTVRGPRDFLACNPPAIGR
jgi:hypothetical protein